MENAGLETRGRMEIYKMLPVRLEAAQEVTRSMWGYSEALESGASKGVRLCILAIRDAERAGKDMKSDQKMPTSVAIERQGLTTR